MKANPLAAAAFIFPAILCLCVRPVSAATPDSVANDLDIQRATYERKMESLRTDIQKKFIGELSAAPKDLDKAKSVGAEQDAFKAEGKLPEGPAFEPFAYRYAALANNMDSAYATAITSYRKASATPLADQVQADADYFNKNWDLVPWKDLIAQPGNVQSNVQKPTVVSAASPLNANLDQTGEYRLEIRGKRTSSNGAASVTIPMPDGQPVTIPVVVSTHGDIHVFLSVYRDHVSADLGVQRPVNINAGSNAAVISARKITVTTDGALTIDALRVAPVVAGTRPAVQLTAALQNEQPARDDAATLLSMGSTWTGTLERLEGSLKGAQPATGKVIAVNKNMVTVRLGTNQLGAHDWVFLINGNTLTLIRTSPVQLREIHVSGTLKDGTLTVSGSWVNESGNRGNGQRATLILTKD